MGRDGSVAAGVTMKYPNDRDNYYFIHWLEDYNRKAVITYRRGEFRN
jgi:hypothetical protein